MGNVTRSQSQNIKSPDGNSLAVFVDGNDDVMKVKDVRGNVQDISDFTGSESSYLYAYSDELQQLNIVENIVTFNNLQLNKNINLTNENTITFDKKGVYNFNLSLQLNDSTGNFEFAVVNILNNEQPINYSSKEYYIFGDNSVKYAISYNITLNIVGNENLKFNIAPNIDSTNLSPSPNTIPSATLTINKIG
jgi:hypothetical protein